MLSRGTISITGTLPALRGALLFPAQMLGGIVVCRDAWMPSRIRLSYEKLLVFLQGTMLI